MAKTQGLSLHIILIKLFEKAVHVYSVAWACKLWEFSVDM